MTTLTTVLDVRKKALAALDKAAWLPPTLARVAMGVVFRAAGWGKVNNLEKVTGFFTELGIPMPGLNAVVVSYSELVCGALLIVGLGSRLATIPLVVSMAVALLTAKRADIHGLADLFGTVEFTYLALLLVVAVAGPGPFSLDHLLMRRLGGTKPRDET
jgi:putative oxidoreductase